MDGWMDGWMDGFERYQMQMEGKGREGKGRKGKERKGIVFYGKVVGLFGE